MNIESLIRVVFQQVFNHWIELQEKVFEQTLTFKEIDIYFASVKDEKLQSELQFLSRHILKKCQAYEQEVFAVLKNLRNYYSLQKKRNFLRCFLQVERL